VFCDKHIEVAGELSGLETAASKENRDLWFVLIVPLLFSVPFLLFSIPGGFLADKYSKRSVTIWTVAGEFVVMGLATWALAEGRLGWAAVALFFMSTIGAIFGPTKYGLLPELLPESRLSWGNGVIEFLTLMAAIIAALAGGYFAHAFRGRQVLVGRDFHGAGGDRFTDQSGDFARSCRRSRAQF